MNQDPNVQMLGESENYAIWVSKESQLGEVIYHVEVGNITLHFFEDEWEEFVDVFMQAIR
jgi:hypothetical protein